MPPLGSLAKGIDASLSISRDLALTSGGIVPPWVRDLNLIDPSMVRDHEGFEA